jgi:hypothetical protein
VRIRKKFHSGSFAARRETGYSVVRQLHDLPGKRKKFITLANRDVYENAWYIIHGLSRSAFFLYKSAAKIWISKWMSWEFGSPQTPRSYNPGRG